MTRSRSALAALTFLVTSPAIAADPPVPPGKDPGGPAVALVTTGIDYTAEDVSRLLARDGEGELIGWDFVDNDRRPYAPAGGTDDTPLARLFVGTGMRLVPIRVDIADPMSLARGAAFAGKTPARVAIVPVQSRRSEDWAPLRAVAQHMSDITFIAMAAGEPLKADQAASLALPNIVLLSTETCAQSETRESVADILNLLCLHPRAP